MNKLAKVSFSITNNEKIFNQYKKLVPYFFNKITSKNSITLSDKEDILSNTYLVLWQTILKHKGENNKSFRAYLYIKIRGSIIDSLRKRSKTFQKNYVFVRRVKLIIEASNTARPLESSDFSLSSVFDNAYEYALRYKLLNISNNEEITDSSTLVSDSEKRTCLERNIATLSDNEGLVIKEHYLNDKAFVQICNENPHLSKSWVSKIHKRAIKKLKERSFQSESNTLRLQA